MIAITISNFVEMIRFFTTLILNVDESELLWVSESALRFLWGSRKCYPGERFIWGWVLVHRWAYIATDNKARDKIHEYICWDKLIEICWNTPERPHSWPIVVGDNECVISHNNIMVVHMLLLVQFAIVRDKEQNVNFYLQLILVEECLKTGENHHLDHSLHETVLPSI